MKIVWKIIFILTCFFVLHHILPSQTYAKICTSGIEIPDNTRCPEDEYIPPPPNSPTPTCQYGVDPQGGCLDKDGFGDCKGNAACILSQQTLKCAKKYSEKYCNCKYILKGVYLNTEVPFIGDPSNPRCLVLKNSPSAGVNVLQALTKILMTFVMIGGFAMIVWGGVQIAAGNVKEGREKIIGVVIAFALLGSIGVILRFINPNFFS